MAYCFKRLQHWATHMLILGLGLKQQKNHELQGLAPEKKGGLHYGGKKKVSQLQKSSNNCSQCLTTTPTKYPSPTATRYARELTFLTENKSVV